MGWISNSSKKEEKKRKEKDGEVITMLGFHHSFLKDLNPFLFLIYLVP